MRLAALYDIHGNLPALEAVLEEISDLAVDQILVGGDVFPGPMAHEVLDRLLALDMPVQFLHGNGDREVLEIATGKDPEAVPASFREIVCRGAAELSPEHKDLLIGWPATVGLTVDGLGDVLFCHATPRNDTEIFTRNTPDEALQEIFIATGADVVVCGHTHMQFDRQIGSTRVVNAGSVGMPFAEPGAYWLLLGPDVELRKTSYDFAAAAVRVRETNYPEAETFAQENILDPPSEQQMLELFSRAELK